MKKLLPLMISILIPIVFGFIASIDQTSVGVSGIIAGIIILALILTIKISGEREFLLFSIVSDARFRVDIEDAIERRARGLAVEIHNLTEELVKADNIHYIERLDSDIQERKEALRCLINQIKMLNKKHLTFPYLAKYEDAADSNSLYMHFISNTATRS